MARHRLLLISYHYPPSEAAGALRWQRFTPIAVQHGWDVHAVTLAPGLAEQVDWTRVAELPSQIRIHGVHRPRPVISRMDSALVRAWRALRKPTGRFPPPNGRPHRSRPSYRREELTWLGDGARSVFRIRNVVLDQIREKAWASAAVETGIRIGRSFRPDVVLSCGPPHLAHEAGRRLAARFGVPFVMDMRDPWSLQTRLQEDGATPLWFVLARRAEARCVKQASLVVMNTNIAAKAMERAWPGARIIPVLNGWDDEPLPRRPWPAQFRIVYAGSIYIDRTPRPFFRALARMVTDLQLTPSEVELRLIGTVEAFGREPVSNMAAEEGVREYLRIIPRLPRKEVLEEYAEAAVLLSLPQDSHYAIPSKIYEYIRQPCWILAQAASDSATGELLQNSNAFLANPEDTEGMADFLRLCYQNFREGRRPAPIAADGRFSRATQGAALMRELESLVTRG